MAQKEPTLEDIRISCLRSIAWHLSQQCKDGCIAIGYDFTHDGKTLSELYETMSDAILAFDNAIDALIKKHYDNGVDR
jgi:hypothetical protein